MYNINTLIQITKELSERDTFILLKHVIDLRYKALKAPRSYKDVSKSKYQKPLNDSTKVNAVMDSAYHLGKTKEEIIKLTVEAAHKYMRDIKGCVHPQL